MQEKVFSFLRNFLPIIGGYFIGKQLFGTTVDESIWEGIVGTVLVLVGTVWSFVDKTVTIEKLQVTVRHVARTIGGILIGSGKLSAESLELWTGIIVAAIPIIQGIMSKKKAQQLKDREITPQQLKS